MASLGRDGQRAPTTALASHVLALYLPAAWPLGGFLALWLPIRAVPAAFSFIGFFAAGAGMFTLARRYLSPRFALAAAVLYGIYPYHLITVYWDFRVAEMLASAMFPVAILFALRCVKDSRAIVGLAISRRRGLADERARQP